jgi:exosome complex RNA-binding protein Rrp42 (RNase PH superfamily)
MDIALLKQLLPGEVNEFYIRNEIRADGRDLRHHRKFFIAREVLHTGQASKYSTSVKLGNTHVLCSLAVSEQTG